PGARARSATLAPSQTILLSGQSARKDATVSPLPSIIPKVQLAIRAREDSASTVMVTGLSGPSLARTASGGSWVTEPLGGVVTSEKGPLFASEGLYAPP